MRTRAAADTSPTLATTCPAWLFDCGLDWNSPFTRSRTPVRPSVVQMVDGTATGCPFSSNARSRKLMVSPAAAMTSAGTTCRFAKLPVGEVSAPSAGLGAGAAENGASGSPMQ